MNGPFTGFYVRYVLSWLVFGLLVPVVVIEYSAAYALGSVAAALILTFGIDMAAKEIARRKAQSMVNEEVTCIVKGYRHGNGRRGYVVMTDSYFLFVPVFRKIRTVLETDHIVRRQVDGLTAEVTARMRHQYRTFTFSLLSKRKLLANLEQAVKETLPHKRAAIKK
jgi:hypothetical protein